MSRPKALLARRRRWSAAARVPFMMQNTGGMISRAMALHMSSVFPTATFPTGNASEVPRTMSHCVQLCTAHCMGTSEAPYKGIVPEPCAPRCAPIGR